MLLEGKRQRNLCPDLCTYVGWSEIRVKVQENCIFLQLNYRQWQVRGCKTLGTLYWRHANGSVDNVQNSHFHCEDWSVSGRDQLKTTKSGGLGGGGGGTVGDISLWTDTIFRMEEDMYESKTMTHTYKIFLSLQNKQFELLLMWEDVRLSSIK